MQLEKNTVADISRQRIEQIEDHCRQMRSEAVAEGVIAFFSALRSRNRKITLKPLKERGILERTA